MVYHPVLLTVTNLGRQLAHRWLWRGVSFEVRAGDRMGLVAPSGAGKTLLLRTLVQLDSPQEGEIAYAGRPLSQWSLPQYRTQVMYLPQRPTPFAGTVADNLSQIFQLEVHRQRRYDSDQIVHWLEQLGRSADFLQRQARQLSGGETQLLALLRALQLQPTLLLLDEPTASLDPDTTTRLEALLDHWLGQGQRAYLLTSHDGAQIRRITHRQLRLQEFTDAV